MQKLITKCSETGIIGNYNRDQKLSE